MRSPARRNSIAKINANISHPHNFCHHNFSAKLIGRLKKSRGSAKSVSSMDRSNLTPLTNDMITSIELSAENVSLYFRYKRNLIRKKTAMPIPKNIKLFLNLVIFNKNTTILPAHKLSYPNYIHQMFDFLKFRITGYYNSLILNSRGKSKAVCIRNTVLGLVFCGLENQFIGDCQNGKV